MFSALFFTFLIGVSWGQTLLDTYADGDFALSPVWGGNTSAWAIQANSDAAAGATGSYTLRLATTGGGTKYLSTQISSWGTSQEWGFWVGRRTQAFTSSNQMYIWLYANESNLTSVTVDGYRLAIGDDSGGDDIRLEYIVNGAVSATVIASAGSIATGLTDIGFLIRVTRSSTGAWEIFTSTLPSSNGSGAIASTVPNSTNASTSGGTGTNNSLAPATNGYIGVGALHSTGASALAAVEFDQVYFTPSFSSSSNIIANAGFTYPTNIDYTAYQGTTLTTANSIEVAQFDIQDGGGSADDDALTTELTALTLSVANSGGLRRIALFDGGTNLAEVSGGSSAAFTGLTLSAADDGSKTFSVRVSFLSSVTDNQQFSFTVNSATANSSGSTFAAANAGAAITSTSGDMNRIEVLTTDIIFDQDVSDVSENGVMSPSLTVRAVDNNVNFDLDNTSNVEMIISSGSTTFGGTATTTVAMVAGTATFSNLVFSTPASTNALTATQGAFTDVSSNFNVTAAAPEINVKQNVTSLASGSGSHAAGSIVSGNSGSAITFTIENLGSANLTYSSITSSNTTDFTLDLTGASTPIVPSGITTFTVTFNPTTAGAKSTTITINNNDTNEGIYTFTITGTGTVSSASDLITNAGFSYSSNIAYASFQTASTLTTGNSVAVNGLTLRDGGATADADNLATVLTSISFSTGGSTAIRTAALFDGTTNIAEVAVNGATTIAFSGLTITAADAATKNFELRVSYQASVTDNQQITFTVSSATASASTSGFAAANAGAASSLANSDINRLEVTADRLAWVQQPSAVSTGANMSPFPTISANDANSNRDLDYTSTITLTPSASTISAGGSTAAVSGLATFSGLQFSSAVNGVTLSGSEGSLISTGNSSGFNITIQEPGLLLTDDDFNYTASSNIITVGTNWGITSLNATKLNTTAANSGLSLTDYPSTITTGISIVAASAEDVAKSFTPQSTGSVYTSTLINLTSTGTGGYLFGFTPNNTSTTYEVRVHVRTVSGNLNFGISRGSGSVSWDASNYTFNTTYFLAVKLTMNNSTNDDRIDLFVSTSITNSEPSVPNVTITGATDVASIAAVFVRQDATAGSGKLDGIRVATNWGTLVGNPQYSSSYNIATGNYNNINVNSGTLTAIGNVTVHGTTTNDGAIAIGANTLTINGSISGSGQIDASSGTVAFGNATDLSFPTSVFSGTIANLSKSSGAGTLTINDDLSLTNLSTSANTGAVVLAANKQLTLSGTLTNNGTLTLENGATLVQGTASTASTATNNGYVVKQVVTGAGGNTPNGRSWYLGAPVSGATSNVIAPSGSGNLLYHWNANASTPSWTQVSAGAGSNLEVGKGYLIRMGAASTTLNFAANTLNNAPDVSPLTLPCYRQNSTVFQGFNLVSNPFPSYLNWNDVYTANSTAFENTMWYRIGNGSGTMVFDTYVAGGVGTNNYGGTAVSSYIPPMQAFWVRLNSSVTPGSSATNLSLTNGMRSHYDGGAGAGLKSSIQDLPAFVRLNLIQDNKKDQVIVYMRPEAQNQYDLYDAEKMFLTNYPQIYTKIGDKKLVINGMKNNKNQTIVPLYLEIPSNGVYVLNTEEFNIESGLILLEDKQEGIIQDLTINDNYVFYANSGVLTNRFFIRFQLPDPGITATGPSNNWVESQGYPEGGEILISTNGRGKVIVSQDFDVSPQVQSLVQITDASGKQIFEGAFEGAVGAFELQDMQNGIYFVRVELNGKVEVKKIVVQL